MKAPFSAFSESASAEGCQASGLELTVLLRLCKEAAPITIVALQVPLYGNLLEKHFFQVRLSSKEKDFLLFASLLGDNLGN